MTSGELTEGDMAELKRQAEQAKERRQRAERQPGLHDKYIVQRLDARDEPGQKHHGCKYFVLDLTHDWHARKALLAYMDAIKAENPALRADIAELLRACDFGLSSRKASDDD